MFGYVSAYTVESRIVLHANARKTAEKHAAHSAKLPSEGRGRGFEFRRVHHFPPFSDCAVFGNVYGYVTNRPAMMLKHHAGLTDSECKEFDMATDYYDTTEEKFKSDWLYFIRSEDGLTKIGRSANVANRLTRLRTGNPKELNLIGAIEDAGWMEKLWHHAFQMQRVRGEWFEADSGMDLAIVEALDGNEWIATLTAPDELASHHPKLSRTELNSEWRHEIADYETALEDAMHGALA